MQFCKGINISVDSKGTYVAQNGAKSEDLLARGSAGNERLVKCLTAQTEIKEASDSDTGGASGARSAWSLFACLMPESDTQTASQGTEINSKLTT